MDQNKSSIEQNPVDLMELLEAMIFSSLEPIPVAIMLQRVNEYYQELTLNPVSQSRIIEALGELKASYQNRAVHLVELSGGYCFEVHSRFKTLLKPTESNRNSKPSKAYLETLTLIAYKQPITRSEIEAIRGVSVSSNIIRDLLERDWIKVAGYKPTPGTPAIYETTQHFLDSFHLNSINDLPEVDFKPNQEAKGLS